MIPVTFDFDDVQSVIRIQGKDFLFCDIRIDRDSVPKELPYVYDIADGDSDGCIARIQPFVMVNYWGTILGKEPLDLNDDGAYYPEYGSEEYEGCYDSAPDTLQDYLDGNYDSPDDTEDGTSAVRPGTRYKLEITPDSDGAIDREELDEVLKLLGFTDIDIREENGDTVVRFSPTEVVRNMEVKDSLWEFGIVSEPCPVKSEEEGK